MDEETRRKLYQSADLHLRAREGDIEAIDQLWNMAMEGIVAKGELEKYRRRGRQSRKDEIVQAVLAEARRDLSEFGQIQRRDLARAVAANLNIEGIDVTDRAVRDVIKNDAMLELLEALWRSKKSSAQTP